MGSCRRPIRNSPIPEIETSPRASMRGMDRGSGCLNKRRWMPRMYSRESAYAICALVRMAKLASYSAGKYFQVAEIVGGEHRPPQYLAKILQRLSREGILQSHKGPSVSSGSGKNRLAQDYPSHRWRNSLLRAVCSGVRKMFRQAPMRDARKLERRARMHSALCQTDHS